MIVVRELMADGYLAELGTITRYSPPTRCIKKESMADSPSSSRPEHVRYVLEPDRRRLLIDGAPAALGTRAIDVLCLLVEHRDRVVTKDELLDRVWPSLIVEENNVQVQISGLRRLLGAGAITTV